MSEETELLRDVVRDVLAAGATPEATARAEQAEGVPDLWREIAALDWPLIGIATDDAHEPDAVEQLAVVLEAIGRHAALVPLAETGLARWILGGTDVDLAADAVLTVAPVRPSERLRMERRAGEVVLTGVANRVPWAGQAGAIVAYADDGDRERAVLVRGGAAGLDIGAGRNLAAEPRDRVTFASVACPASAVVEHAPSRPAAAARAALGRTAATVGALEAAYETTREHVRSRRQFDRPLVRLQIVGAHLARMASDVALARASLASAVAAHAGAEDPAWAIAAAKVMSARAAGAVARRAHQLHGAIGTTREHTLQLWTRRLWAWRDEAGTEREWGARLGADVSRGGSDALWHFVTRREERHG